MEFWIYVYIGIAVFFVFAVIWIYTKACEWWGEHITGEENYLKEIFIYENNQHHLLRSYLIENYASLDYARETLELYMENSQFLLDLWSKILNKEHFLNFVDLQRKRWNLHLSIIEGDDKSKTSKTLRSVNRKLSQLHEDWWGLKFDSSGYMRELNEMDSDIIELKSCIIENNTSNSIFHSILFHQETIEKKIQKVLI